MGVRSAWPGLGRTLKTALLSRRLAIILSRPVCSHGTVDTSEIPGSFEQFCPTLRSCFGLGNEHIVWRYVPEVIKVCHCKRIPPYIKIDFAPSHSGGWFSLWVRKRVGLGT